MRGRRREDGEHLEGCISHRQHRDSHAYRHLVIILFFRMDGQKLGTALRCVRAAANGPASCGLLSLPQARAVVLTLPLSPCHAHWRCCLAGGARDCCGQKSHRQAVGHAWVLIHEGAVPVGNHGAYARSLAGQRGEGTSGQEGGTTPHSSF